MQVPPPPPPPEALKRQAKNATKASALWKICSRKSLKLWGNINLVFRAARTSPFGSDDCTAYPTTLARNLLLWILIGQKMVAIVYSSINVKAVIIRKFIRVLWIFPFHFLQAIHCSLNAFEMYNFALRSDSFAEDVFSQNAYPLKSLWVYRTLLPVWTIINWSKRGALWLLRRYDL